MPPECCSALIQDLRDGRDRETSLREKLENTAVQNAALQAQVMQIKLDRASERMVRSAELPPLELPPPIVAPTQQPAASVNHPIYGKLVHDFGCAAALPMAVPPSCHRPDGCNIQVQAVLRG